MQPQALTFQRGSFTLAAELYLPDGPGNTPPSPALVITGPGSSVKEQIAANYAQALAALGYIVLTFDPAHQGASSGEPRDLESPADRVADLRGAVDFLLTRSDVDAARIGVLGICAGGGYATAATMTDHRVKALGLVVASDIGAAFRAMAEADDGIVARLEKVAELATAEAKGASPVRHQWIPDTLDEAQEAGITDIDTLQAVTYYRTPRGQHPRSTNRRHYVSDALILGFDAFDLADTLLTQPTQIIVGGASKGTTGSYEAGYRLAGLAPAAEPVLEIPGARHYEMYDVPDYVDQAIARLDTFFARHLAA